MSEKEHSAEELGESGGEDGPKSGITNFFNSPAYMSPTLRRQFLKYMIKSLPPNSQRCVKALKNLQLEQLNLEVKFYEEIFQLQKKYSAMYEPLHEKRTLIVNGDYTPNDTECEFKSDNEDDEELSESVKTLSDQFKNKFQFNFDSSAKGIPKFWLTVFKNSDIISEMIQDHDEEALTHLKDVKLIFKEDDPMSYVIEFHFTPNEYFTNTVLTKQYYLRSTLSPEEPFAFEGPEIYKCTGCDINWNKGMNLTVKTIRKKQKHKARNAVRTVTKQVPTESFFNFFNPPKVSDDIQKVDVESQAILANDFEVGHFLRERIIPKAALYYTGDYMEEQDDDLDEEDEDDEEEEEEEDEDEDDGLKPNAKTNKKGNTPVECPQQ